MSAIKVSASADIDRQTWNEVVAVLDSHCLTISEALHLMMRHIADAGELPFACFIPGPKTIAAMEEAERDELVTFNSVAELMADLNSDEED